MRNLLENLTSLEYISDDIDQNLLRAQFVEKCFKVLVELFDQRHKRQDVFKMKMRSKSYSLNLMEEEQIKFLSTTINVDLWHKDSYKGIQIIENKLTNCVTCQFCKLVRKPFFQIT